MEAVDVLLASGPLAVLLFTLVWLVEGRLRPDYRPGYHPISALSLGSRGWVQVVSFVVTGLLLLGFSEGVRLAVGGVAVPALLRLAGFGLVGAGVFTMDPMRGTRRERRWRAPRA